VPEAAVRQWGFGSHLQTGDRMPELQRMGVQGDAAGRAIGTPFPPSGTVLHIAFDGMPPGAELSPDLVKGTTLGPQFHQRIPIAQGQDPDMKA
jgi:hypothetical protein